MSINHEELALTLLTTKTIKETSQKMKISEQSVYRIKSSEGFERIYNKTRDNLYKESANKAQGMSVEALGVLYDIMKDEQQNPNARIQCARSILEMGNKSYESQKSAGGSMFDDVPLLVVHVGEDEKKHQ